MSNLTARDASGRIPNRPATGSDSMAGLGRCERRTPAKKESHRRGARTSSRAVFIASAIVAFVATFTTAFLVAAHARQDEIGMVSQEP